MHWLDCTVIALLAAAALLGAWSGLLTQVFRLVGFGLAAYAAVSLHWWAEQRLRERLMIDADPDVRTATAYGLVFLGVYSAIFVASRLLQRGVEAANLQFYNRVFGAALAAAKMTMCLGVICFCLQHLPFPEPKQTMQESVTAPVLAQGMSMVVEVIPASYKNDVSNSWRHLRGTLPEG